VVLRFALLKIRRANRARERLIRRHRKDVEVGLV
jgi:hypothetical protein